MEELLCTKCNEIKPLNDFPNRKNGRSGKSWNCKKCTNEYYKTYKKNVSLSSDAKLTKYFNYKINIIKKQDKNKFPEFNNTLTVDDLLEVYKKYDGKCVYSRKKLKPGSKTNIYVKISFDRIDNSIPHTKENLQLTSVFMNMYRSDKNHEEFNDYIKSFE
jgi:hypothetical protein